MTDKQPPEPTDAELDELRQANSGKLNFVTFSEFRTIARAVLAKWGTPQPVERVPLTDEHLRVIERMHVYAHTATLMDFARAIERAHGITTNGRKDAP